MSNIEILMRELNLDEDIIKNTVHKIDFICSKYTFSGNITAGSYINMGGNGNGNGNN